MVRAVRCVLVVEDNRVVSEMLREMLAQQEIDANAAFSVPEAEQVFSLINFDAILLDASLDGRLDTLPFLKKIKDSGFPGLIIAISGEKEHNDVLCAHGATVGINKFFSRDIVHALRSS